MRGRGPIGEQAYRGQNIAPERIENYEVDPQTLLLQFKFEDEGHEMMGIYHSHPVSVAYPSATDAWNAHYPDCFYFICSLENDEAPVLRVFRLITQWLDLDVANLRQALHFYETRPHLFAYFQSSDQPMPPVLAVLNDTLAPPFYVDFYTDDRGEIADSRVVTVREHPLQVI